MPPRRRSERTKKEVEADIDTTEITSTPSKKRRRLNGSENTAPSPAPVQAQPVQPLDHVGTPDSAETKDIETEKEPLTNDEIIANLQVGRYTVNASVDLNNDLHGSTESTPAFAKIAGRDWSFLLKDTRALIGRADRPGQINDASMIDNPSSHSANTGANFAISIDLGPSREVSRVHAEIQYNSDTGVWMMRVDGRNGLKLDDKIVTKGTTVPLRSGAVITILGTQMMFILPNEEAQVHPKFKQQALADPGETSTDDETRKRRRNGAGFSDDRQFTDLDPFPPSSVARRSLPISHSKPRNGHQDSVFRAAAFAGAPQPATPSASRGKEKVAVSPGPGYPRGVMLESTEDVDYSADAAKDLKPPHSYAQLIGQAILSSPDEMLTLANIYQYIREKYAFYRESGGGWQNSIRHNLSLSKAFEKVARRTDEPGKGMKWKIVDDQRDEFIRKTLMNGRRGTARMGSSGPNSPAAGAGPSSHPGERVMGVLRDPGRPRTSDSKAKSHRSVTPPPHRSLLPNEAYTPERGSRLAMGPMATTAVNGSEQTRTPLNNRRGLNSTHPSYAPSSSANVDPTSRLDRDTQAPDATSARGLTDAAVQSPPPIYGTETGRHNSMVTPLVARQTYPLAPPSTAQAPSQFIQLSSPAPFWKFADYGSTPARPDFSPTKTKEKTLGDEREPDSDTPDIPAQPSSPPVLGGDNDENDDTAPPEPLSPSRSQSRPVSRKRTHSMSAGTHRASGLMGTFSNGGSAATKIVGENKNEQAHASNSAVRIGTSGAPPRPTSTPATASAHGLPVGLGLALTRSGSAPKAGAEESEEEGIDLAKGFQKIGNFHRNLSQSHGHGAVRAP